MTCNRDLWPDADWVLVCSDKSHITLIAAVVFFTAWWRGSVYVSLEIRCLFYLTVSKVDQVSLRNTTTDCCKYVRKQESLFSYVFVKYLLDLLSCLK